MPRRARSTARPDTHSEPARVVRPRVEQLPLVVPPALDAAPRSQRTPSAPDPLATDAGGLVGVGRARRNPTVSEPLVTAHSRHRSSRVALALAMNVVGSSLRRRRAILATAGKAVVIESHCRRTRRQAHRRGASLDQLQVGQRPPPRRHSMRDDHVARQRRGCARLAISADSRRACGACRTCAVPPRLGRWACLADRDRLEHAPSTALVRSRPTKIRSRRVSEVLSKSSHCGSAYGIGAPLSPRHSSPR